MSIGTSLSATGIADVIVILRPGLDNVLAVSATVPPEIARHFVSSPFSQDGALLEMLSARGALSNVPAVAPATTAAVIGGAINPQSTPRFFPNLGIALGTVDAVGLGALQNEGRVSEVVAAPQLQLIKPVVAAPAQTQLGYTWGLQAIGVHLLHAQGFTGRGVLVGHLDTGVDASHPALVLVGAVREYAEFDGLGSEIPGVQPRDSGIHGTHTAGTIAGRSVNEVHFGVAPRATLACAMVIEGGNVLAVV